MAKEKENVVYSLSMLNADDPAVKHNLDVAQKYLSDNKGVELQLSDHQFDSIQRAVFSTSDDAYISNRDLAAMNAVSFSALHDDVRMSTLQIQQEVRAVGNLVAACHADNIAKLNEIQKGLQAVNNNVMTVGENLSVVAQSLLDLRADFNRYVKKDELVNNIQIAKQQLITLNQQIEADFGHNKELRRTAVGILQANDLNVRTDTITTRSEELCLSTPNYWLAPALVALGWWIAASRAVAEGQASNGKEVQAAVSNLESMLREAYARECSKTALFFGLICRRAGNTFQANEWFKEYLAFQNPREVDHTCMVLLNLYASGIMGRGAEEQAILGTLAGWLDELMNDSDGTYQAQLLSDWANTCRMLYELAEPAPASYVVLPAFSPTWPALQQATQASLLHARLLEFLETELARKDFAEDDITIIDGLSADLVTDYDADELPIRREQEYQQLIVDLKGNQDLAFALRSIKDDILSETKSFVSILSDAARNSELSGASDATAVYALRLQMPWVKQAYEGIALQNREQTPREIAIDLGNFQATTEDGSNEEEVIEAFVNHVNNQEKNMLEKSKTGMVQKVALIGGAVLAVVGLIWFFVNPGPLGAVATVGGISAAIYGLVAGRTARKKQAEIREKMSEKRTYGVLLIRKFMEEVKAWRADYAAHEEVSAAVEELFSSMTANLSDGVVPLSDAR